MNDDNAPHHPAPPPATEDSCAPPSAPACVPLHKQLALISITQMAKKAGTLLPPDFLDDPATGSVDLDALTARLTTQTLTLDTTFYHILRTCDGYSDARANYHLAVRVQDQFLRALKLLRDLAPPPPPSSSSSSSSSLSQDY